MGNLVYSLMASLNNVLGHNPIVTVVLFTILLRLIMSPLDIISRKSMQKQQAAQPYIARIQKKYAGNPQLMQRKMSEFNKKHGISLMKGCLPLIITLPLFVIFLNAMTTWGYIASINTYLDVANGATDISANSWLWIHNIWQPDSGLAPVVMTAEKIAAIPFDSLSSFFDATTLETVKAAAANGGAGYASVMAPIAAQYEGYANGWFILPLVSGAFVILQQYVTIGPKKSRPKPVEGMPNTSGMGMSIAIAVFSAYICLQYNAMFAIYWIVSNMCATILTYILKKIYPASSYVFEGEAELG